MKKMIILSVLLILFSVGCEQNVFAPDSDGITRFGFEDVNFEYHWATSTMYGLNPSETGGYFVFKIDDWCVNQRHGNKLNLPPYDDDSFVREYWHGVELKVEYCWDGICDKFYMTLE